jgi:hypothetical protein
MDTWTPKTVILTHFMVPGLPLCMIWPVNGSVDLKTGHPLASDFAKVNSNFVPMILNLLFSGMIPPKSDHSAVYRLLSDVRRSRSSVSGDVNFTCDLLTSIFFKYSDAMTDSVVW